MNTTAQITFENISKEVKTKISKLGKDQLLKKYNTGIFEENEEEKVAALYYIDKRGQRDQITFYPTFSKHVSQMTDEEKTASESKLEEKVAQNREKIEQEEQKEKAEQQSKQEVVQKKADKPKKDSKSDKKSVEPSEKDVEFNGVMLTDNEVLLLDQIWNDNPKSIKNVPQLMEALNVRVRTIKATLASLKHKGIVDNWSKEEDSVVFTEYGTQVVNGEVKYKAKKKYEKSNATVGRVIVEIDGKPMEKSGYVRKMLRADNNISAADINAKLAELGFNKLYHSELMRCKQQLGIPTARRGEDI